MFFIVAIGSNELPDVEIWEKGLAVDSWPVFTL